MGTKLFLIRARILFLLPVLLLNSCAGDDAQQPVVPVEDATVTFSVNIPGSAPAATRGLSVLDETNVETIDVLLFSKEGTRRVYYGRVLGVSIENTPGNTKSFRAVIPVKDYTNFDISIIANARDIVLTAGLTEGEEKNATLEKLIKEVPAGEKWNSNRIPMWGESLDVEVNESTNLSGQDAVSLSRMVSRIDVKLSRKAATGSDDQDATGNGNFELTSVRLYNYNTRGTVAPDLVSGWNPGNTNDPPTATAPHMPSGGYGTALYPDCEPLLYTAGDEHSGDGFMPDSIIRAIYTFESAAGSPSSLETNTCLVIGGKYRGGNETFYRVDFARKSGTNQYEYLPLRRNFLYSIKITHITGEGYTDPDEAFHSRPVNIETVITEWNDGDMDDTEFNGQNRLTVSRSNFFFYDQGRPQTMRIFTDHPRGWRVEQSSRPSWLNISPDSDNSGGTVEVTIDPGHISSFAPEVAYGDTLRYNFWILAGNIRKEISIEQVNEPELMLTLDPEYIVFQKYATQPKEFTVTTYPAGLPVTFSPVSGDMTWRPSGFPEYSPYAGGVYSLHPQANHTDPPRQLNSSIAVTVQSGEKLLTKILQVVHTIAHSVFFWTPLGPYPAEGGDFQISVTSDSDWWVYSMFDKEGVFGYGKPDQTVKQAGTVPYILPLDGNDSWYPREAFLYVTSNDPDFWAEHIHVPQEGNVPAISIDKTNEINFSGGPVTVNVTSNARWKFTTDAEFAKVAAADLTAGTVYGYDTPLTHEKKGSVIFTPKSYGAVNGTPVAGTKYTTTVTYNTEAYLPEGVEQVSKTSVMTNTVPGYWTAGSALFVPASGVAFASSSSQTVRITANTNAGWRVTPSVTAGNNIAVKNYAASAYQTDKVIEITIDRHNGGWGDRTVTLKVTNDANSTTQSATYTQKGYYINRDGFSISSLTNMGNGGQVTVKGRGWFPGGEVGVRLLTRVGSNYVTISEDAYFMTAAGSQTAEGETSTIINLPKNETGAPRDIYIQYFRGGSMAGYTSPIATQPKGNIYLTASTRVVAVADAKLNGISGDEKMTWAQTMGITTYPAAINYDRTYLNNPLNYTPTENTGCNAYYEGSASDSKTGRGKWRVPTIAELDNIYALRAKIGDMVEGYYSASQDYDFEYAYMLWIRSGRGEIEAAPKPFYNFRVRCVRNR